MNMQTIIVNIPNNEKDFFIMLMRKFKYKNTIISNEEMEDKELSKWIQEGMETEDVPIEKVFKLLEKYGVDS